jgi:hypothetical protein
MKKTRNNVFETNSSSTHSICIAKDIKYDLPSSIYFEFGEFGWEEDRLSTNHEKASYLYTAIMNYGNPKDMDNIVGILEQNGVEVTCEPIKSEDNWGDGYVDHGCNLGEFMHSVCNSEEKMFSFLFSDLSFVLTGNDNNQTDVDIKVSYEHDEFFKGN